MNKDDIFYNYVMTCRGAPRRALTNLYKDLIDIKLYPKKCEDFIKSIEYDALDMDGITHILNALSPVKEDIPNWDDLVFKSTKRLSEITDEKTIEIILKVIL